MKRNLTITILLLLCCSMSLPATAGNSAKSSKKRTRSCRELVIAASNSPKEDIHLADYVCDGVNDEATINEAIESLEYGGSILLLDGDYYIDAFEHEGNSAILFGFNEGRARTITIKGLTESKAYNTHYGASLHVTEKAMKAMDPDSTYRVFYGTAEKPIHPETGDSNGPGMYFRYTYVNNANFENFILFFFDASKKLVGFDCGNFGNCLFSLASVYTEKHFEERYLHLDPTNPVEGCIGVISPKGSNDDTSRIGFDNINIGGIHTGIICQGVDHLIMTDCSVARCVLGYWFKGKSAKTLTMINCADEGNTYLPRFSSTGHLTCIDLNIERFNADYIPEDISGSGDPRMVEDKPGGWHGFISYTLQGKAFGLGDGKLWAEGCGQNFKTINLSESAANWDL